MRRTISILTIALCVFSFSGAAHAAKHKSARSGDDANIKFIKQAYAYMDYGWTSMDVNRMTTYTTDDCHFTAGGETVDKHNYQVLTYNEMIRLYPKATAVGMQTTTRSDITSLSEQGPYITINRTLTVHMSTADRTANVYCYFRDVWVRQAKGWFIQDEQQKAFVLGKNTQ